MPHHALAFLSEIVDLGHVGEHLEHDTTYN